MSDFVRPHRRQPTRLLCPWGFPGKNTGVGYHFLLQGIFPSQRSNSGLLHCRLILYPLSVLWLVAQLCWTLSKLLDCSLPGFSVHDILQLRILEWVAMPSSRESSHPRDQTQVSRRLFMVRQILYGLSHQGSPYPWEMHLNQWFPTRSNFAPSPSGDI